MNFFFFFELSFLKMNLFLSKSCLPVKSRVKTAQKKKKELKCFEYRKPRIVDLYCSMFALYFQ